MLHQFRDHEHGTEKSVKQGVLSIEKRLESMENKLRDLDRRGPWLMNRGASVFVIDIFGFSQLFRREISTMVEQWLNFQYKCRHNQLHLLSLWHPVLIP